MPSSLSNGWIIMIKYNIEYARSEHDEGADHMGPDIDGLVMTLAKSLGYL